MLSKLEQNLSKEREKRRAKEQAERDRKRKVWQWIQENDPALAQFIRKAPKGFIKDVRLWTN